MNDREPAPPTPPWRCQRCGALNEGYVDRCECRWHRDALASDIRDDLRRAGHRHLAEAVLWLVAAVVAGALMIAAGAAQLDRPGPLDPMVVLATMIATPASLVRSGRCLHAWLGTRRRRAQVAGLPRARAHRAPPREG